MRRREKDLRQLAEGYGWTLTGRSGTSHYKLAGPRGEVVTVACTTRNRDADTRIAARLRRINAGREEHRNGPVVMRPKQPAAT